MKLKKSAKFLNIIILIITCVILTAGCSTKDVSKTNLYDNINNDSYSISSENKINNKQDEGTVSSHSFGNSIDSDLSDSNTKSQQDAAKKPSPTDGENSNPEQNFIPEQNNTVDSSNSAVNDGHENSGITSQSTENNENQINHQLPVVKNYSSPTENKSSDSSNYCSFIVDCNKALESADLSQNLRNVLPENGIIYSGNPEFNQGESVFDLLKRLMKESGIPLEFSSSPAYGSKYIKGINSLHEFDCGELSGWTYFVNGSRPSYGCDKYIIKPGDDIRWYYTCNLGNDI